VKDLLYTIVVCILCIACVWDCANRASDPYRIHYRSGIGAGR